MNGALPIVLAAGLYFVSACCYMHEGEYSQATVLAGYTLANVGLVLAFR